jgi:type I restriction enzyme M protein
LIVIAAGRSRERGSFVAGRPREQATKPAKTLEQRLWDAADALRGNQEPSEYKHVVLGLVF